MPFDPNAYLQDAQPQQAPTQSKPTLEQFLLGKSGLDPIKDIDKPEYQDLVRQASKYYVNGIAGSFYPEGTYNPVEKPLAWLAEKTGISKIPDYLMQKAVGMKKYIPGVGSELIDQGIVGTKGRMTQQINDQIERRGNELSSAVDSIPSQIDSSQIGQNVGKLSKKYTTSSGSVPALAQNEADLVNSVSQDITSRGNVSPREALEYKRIAQTIGYKKGEPLASLKAQLSQAEAGEYGKALEDAYSQANPDSANQVEESNRALSALLRGKKAITKPVSTSTMGSLLKDAGAAAVGGAVGGPFGAATGVVARRTLSTPLGASVAAQGLDEAGRAIQQAPLRSIPVSILGAEEQENQSGPSPGFDPKKYVLGAQ